MKTFALLFAALLLRVSAVAEEDATAVGAKVMPPGYVLTEGSLSPDGKLGFIHFELNPDEDAEAEPGDFHNYLVRVAPFEILAENLGESYTHPGNHRNVAFGWNAAGNVALLLVGGKWGTIGATLFELNKGTVARKTDLLKLVTQEINPRFKAAKVQPYNDHFNFLITGDDQWKLDPDGSKLTISVGVETRPNLAPGRAWKGSFKGTWNLWNLPAAKWIDHKATGKVVVYKE